MRWLLLLVELFIILLFWYKGLFIRPELLLYDLRVKLIRGPIKPPENIAVILIDEASLKLMNSITGRWPWPRSVHADVIDFIRLGKPEAIVFDILFTEKDKDN